MWGVFGGDDAVECAGGEDVAGPGEEIGGIDGLGTVEAGDAAGFLDVEAELAGVDALGIPEGSGDA